MKLFQIGFNKCGTSTLHHLLHKNGVASVHWDKGLLARRMFRNRAEGKRLLSGYEHYQAFSDMEFMDGRRFLEGYKLFRQLAEEDPDSVFVLNTRDREGWIRSRFRHVGGVFAARHRSYYRTASDEELAEIWRGEWERHHREVLDFFSGSKYRFFVWRIETDLPDLLAKHVPELRIDRSHYRARKVSTKHKSQRPGAENGGRHFVVLHRRALSVLRRLCHAFSTTLS
jgi:hypothetical protein